MSSKKKVSLYRRVDIRLTAWYTFTFLIIVLITFGFLDYRLEHNLLKEVDRLLADEAHEIVSEIVHNPHNVMSHLKQFENIASGRTHYAIAFEVSDSQGEMIYASAPLRGLIFPVCCSEDHGPIVTRNLAAPGRSSRFRLCTYHYQEEGQLKYVVQVATYLRGLDKTTRNFRRNLVLAFMMSMVTGALGGWFLARKTLRPIEEITTNTNRITATNLSERLPITGTDDELDRLAATINDMVNRLEAAFQKLLQFTADAAHELRTPIAALRGETEVILSQDRTSADYREALINNLGRLEFLTRLVNDLLLLAQADEGKGTLRRESIQLNKLVEDLGDAYGAVAGKRGVTLSLDTSLPVSIAGDDTRLRQLFSNLIDNAIKYTPSGGTITIAVVPENEKVSVTITDTGMGIIKEEIPRIFDRFYKVDKSRSREEGGTGLGLSICRWIVEAHKGNIDVKSRPGKGTTIRVTLPSTPAR